VPWRFVRSGALYCFVPMGGVRHSESGRAKSAWSTRRCHHREQAADTVEDGEYVLRASIAMGSLPPGAGRFGERPETLARLGARVRAADVSGPRLGNPSRSLVRQDGGDALLLEDPVERSVHAGRRPWESRVFLRVALASPSAAPAAQARHRAQDVKPAHILVDVGTGQAWLTDSASPRGSPRASGSPGSSRARWPTWRPSRRPDEPLRRLAKRPLRLGVTLYRCSPASFLSRPRTRRSDPSHIARAPKPPGERVQGISAPVEGSS